jgi:DNA-binding response OmpR family regulator
VEVVQVGRILIISTQVLFRALVGAELMERGHEVEGVDALRDAPGPRAAVGRWPDLVILEAHGQTLDRSSLEALRGLCKETIVLVCAGPYDMAGAELAGVGVEHIAGKPLTVGELVERATSLLTRS